MRMHEYAHTHTHTYRCKQHAHTQLLTHTFTRTYSHQTKSHTHTCTSLGIGTHCRAALNTARPLHHTPPSSHHLFTVTSDIPSLPISSDTIALTGAKIQHHHHLAIILGLSHLDTFQVEQLHPWFVPSACKTSTCTFAGMPVNTIGRILTAPFPCVYVCVCVYMCVYVCMCVCVCLCGQ